MERGQSVPHPTENRYKRKQEFANSQFPIAEKALEILRNCNFNIARLPSDNNGSVLLPKEILEADSIVFLVGQKINEFYQNPLLPKNISIRRNLIEDLVKLLQEKQKEVTLEYC